MQRALLLLYRGIPPLNLISSIGKLSNIHILKEESMDEILTIAEIESQFQSEWILVEDPQTNEALEVQSGKVRYHSKDRDEIYRKAIELRPKRFAMLYTGTIPQDTAIVL
jgi:hypothetical protein